MLPAHDEVLTPGVGGGLFSPSAPRPIRVVTLGAMDTDGLKAEVERVGSQLALEEFDDFREQMMGKPIEEIRAALASEWDATDWTDDEIAVLSEGGDIPLNVIFKP
jgi:hypothetical protein